MTETRLRSGLWRLAAGGVLTALVWGGGGEGSLALQSADLDLVLAGGRVMDPESGLDAVRDVGIRGDRVVAISASPLDERLGEGGVRLEIAGLVVAPGFIDLHVHGQSRRASEYQVHDGVTTALELEWGYPSVGEWLESRRGRSHVNYGASVSHGLSRSLAMPDIADQARQRLPAAATEDEPLRPLQEVLSAGFYRSLDEAGMERLARLLRRGLEEGALGVGMAHQYYPGADRAEILRVFELAAGWEVPIFTHVRSMGLDAIQEVVANAAATGASLHIVHVNSSSLDALPVVLDLIAGAREHGADVSTETYPYTAGSTSITSAIFDDGWQERLGISYGDVQLQDTGERLTAESFARYREEGGTVIIHMMRPEMIDLAVGAPFVMIASDGMPYAPGAHPRSAGTFARVLGRYVRERRLLGLMEALRKMTLMPARRLEGVAPEMARRGRVQEGGFADLVVFDAERVRDTATFEEDLSFSEGVVHVLVGGELVVRDGATVEGALPGRPIRGRFAADRE